MDKLDPIITGRDWRYTHTVAISGGGSIAACHSIEMMWKYDATDSDAAAAVKLTWKMAGGGSGIVVIDDTHFEAWIPGTVTRLLQPGALYVGVAYLLMNGETLSELGLQTTTKCLPGVPLDVDA